MILPTQDGGLNYLMISNIISCPKNSQVWDCICPRIACVRRLHCAQELRVPKNRIVPGYCIAPKFLLCPRLHVPRITCAWDFHHRRKLYCVQDCFCLRLDCARDWMCQGTACSWEFHVPEICIYPKNALSSRFTWEKILHFPQE